MNQIEIIPKKEVNEIFKKLEFQFGIKEISGILLRKGKERIFLFRGELSEKDIIKLDSLVEIERAGIYIGKIFEPTQEIRLSIEGTQIFKKQIIKNIFELNSESDYEKWMNGQELNIKTNLRGMIVIRYNEEFLGCGKASEEKIGNFTPKNRRLKIK
jgi:NOL1/NOP2/fmu family ribosome biogenesis protein